MAEEIVRISSPAPAFFDGLLSKRLSAPASEIIGHVRTPDRAIAGAPLVVISIGSMGMASGREDLYSRALNDAGISVFIVDSFGGRGFSETSSDQGRVSWATSTLDALIALRHLAGDSRFDQRRIGLLGYSRGGDVALLACDRRLTELTSVGTGFAAHAALYPPCFCQWDHPRPTDAPVLMIMGGQDPLAPADHGLAYAERLRRAGGAVETRVLSEATHSFDAVSPVSPIEGVHLSRCDVRIADDGRMVERTTGISAKRDWSTFVDRLSAVAGVRGGTAGHGPLPRDVAVPDVVRFFRKSLF